MTLEQFTWLEYGWIAVAVVVFVILHWITAPYGRHTSKKWGPQIPNKLGWVLMELPGLILIPAFYLTGDAPKNWLTHLFMGLYFLHYVNRSLIFPFRTRTTGKKMPLLIALMAIFFNFVNAGGLGYYYGHLAPETPLAWAQNPFFWVGLGLFFLGVFINHRADNILLNLRKPGETGYKIPEGFLFKWISCPNHFGEMVQWGGFALMTFSLPGLTFFIWTVANLLPRALAHHKWYQKKFPDYPAERKAVIPGLL